MRKGIILGKKRQIFDFVGVLLWQVSVQIELDSIDLGATN